MAASAPLSCWELVLSFVQADTIHILNGATWLFQVAGAGGSFPEAFTTVSLSQQIRDVLSSALSASCLSLQQPMQKSTTESLQRRSRLEVRIRNLCPFYIGLRGFAQFVQHRMSFQSWAWPAGSCAKRRPWSDHLPRQPPDLAHHEATQIEKLIEP